jgi:hypothetical protein
VFPNFSVGKRVCFRVAPENVKMILRRKEKKEMNIAGEKNAAA